MACRGADTWTPGITFTFVTCAVHVNMNRTLLSNDNIYAILWLACYRKALKHSYPLVFNSSPFLFSAVLQTSNKWLLSWIQPSRPPECRHLGAWVFFCIKISPFVASSHLLPRTFDVYKLLCWVTAIDQKELFGSKHHWKWKSEDKLKSENISDLGLVALNHLNLWFPRQDDNMCQE